MNVHRRFWTTMTYGGLIAINILIATGSPSWAAVGFITICAFAAFTEK